MRRALDDHVRRFEHLAGALGIDHELVLLIDRDPLHRPAETFSALRDQRGEPVDQRRIAGGRCIALRQIERELTILRDADRLADQVADLGLERDRRAGCDRRYHHRERDFLAIAEGLQSEQLEAVRHRPRHFRLRHIGRPRYVDHERIAGIARRAPIGLPAGLQDDMQRHGNCGEIARPLHGGDQLGTGLRGLEQSAGGVVICMGARLRADGCEHAKHRQPDHAAH